MERAAGPRRRTGCGGAHSGSADGQADQCRISERCFDTARQHHDPRTTIGIGIAFGRTIGKCLNAIAKAGACGIADAGSDCCGQETGSAAQAGPYARTSVGSGCAHAACAGRIQRLIDLR